MKPTLWAWAVAALLLCGCGGDPLAEALRRAEAEGMVLQEVAAIDEPIRLFADPQRPDTPEDWQKRDLEIDRLIKEATTTDFSDAADEPMPGRSAFRMATIAGQALQRSVRRLRAGDAAGGREDYLAFLRIRDRLRADASGQAWPMLTSSIAWAGARLVASWPDDLPDEELDGLVEDLRPANWAEDYLRASTQIGLAQVLACPDSSCLYPLAGRRISRDSAEPTKPESGRVTRDFRVRRTASQVVSGALKVWRELKEAEGDLGQVRARLDGAGETVNEGEALHEAFFQSAQDMVRLDVMTRRNLALARLFLGLRRASSMETALQSAAKIFDPATHRPFPVRRDGPGWLIELAAAPELDLRREERSYPPRRRPAAQRENGPAVPGSAPSREAIEL
ncbi:MAG: hypothetical protein MH204_05880 [Fimbriimonadaceae bacterium]|nr:hypothetical protein [Fimbriimonadaceae bacterium]